MSYVCYLFYFSNFCEKRRRNIRIVFCCLTFCFEIGLDAKMLLFFPNVLYPIFHLKFYNSSFSMLSLIFRALIGWKKKPSEVRRLHLVSLREPDWHLENSRKQQNNSLPKVSMIFNKCSIRNASNMLSLTAILSKAMIFCEMTAIKLDVRSQCVSKSDCWLTYKLAAGY